MTCIIFIPNKLFDFKRYKAILFSEQNFIVYYLSLKIHTKCVSSTLMIKRFKSIKGLYFRTYIVGHNNFEVTIHISI